MTPEQALERVKARLTTMPTSRIVDTNQWDAIRLGDALNVVDQVIAEQGEIEPTPDEVVAAIKYGDLMETIRAEASRPGAHSQIPCAGRPTCPECVGQVPGGAG